MAPLEGWWPWGPGLTTAVPGRSRSGWKWHRRVTSTDERRDHKSCSNNFHSQGCLRGFHLFVTA